MKIKTIVLQLACLSLAFAMLFSASSCAMRISAAELSAGYERRATEEGEVSDQFKAAMAGFSMELFKGITEKDGENDVVSPLSAVICLAMIANGAAGETKAQMEKAFGMDIDTLNESLYAYTNSLYTSKDCKVNLADSIWFRDDGQLKVNEDFLQANADWYDAQVYAAPFDDSTLKDINNWCKKHTDGLIDKIIDSIDRDSVMYLINALLFDAKWQNKYEKSDVIEDDFTNYNGSVSKVQYLTSTEREYFSAIGATGFSKNYDGGKYSFMGILPDAGTDIYDFVNSLDGKAWTELRGSSQFTTVDVKFPEFTYNTEMELNEVLKAMGMNDMFDSTKADFSALAQCTGGNIYCSLVRQKVVVDVSRNGTKAAAITLGEMKAESAMPSTEVKTVILDRPFVYAIVDNASGLPLFVGIVQGL